MNTVKPDAESENEDQNDIRRRLENALVEIDRLRSENARLKSVLETFSLRRASDLTHTTHGRPVPPAKEVVIPAVTIGVEGGAEESPSATSVALSSGNKIGLFRSLFRGREDVYAVRWQSRNGRSGYSPACAHEWDPLLCKKPCSKCSNSQYIPISDKAIREHLVGKKVLGVYPLLTDETCWFLAADF